jgi:hypothetical protein
MLWTTGAPPRKEIALAEEMGKRKRSRAAFWIGGFFLLFCLGLWGLALLTAGFLPVSMPVNLTASAIAQHNAYCAALVQNALDASGDFCDQIGANKVCYGNITLQAELNPGTVERFSQRGDIVSVERLRRLAASPLSLDNNEWGVAIFKVMANLPTSLPGQTVTMVVFGNTVLDNNSENLEAFYFYSQLGRIVCEKAFTEGMLITMPDGAGITFTVNGTELILMGNATLTATQNGEMEVSLHSGSGKIVADGKEQIFSAGEKVSVPLGGPNGTEAIGPPSSPEGLSDEERQEICLLTGELCSEDEPGGTPTAVEPTLLAGTPTGTRTPTPAPSRTATTSPTATASLWYKTLTASRTPTTALTFINTRTPSRTPRPTRTPRTPRGGGGGGPTDTPVPPPPPTSTFTNTPAIGACTTEAVAGSLDNPGGLTDLTMDITNNSGALATISEIRIDWDVATATELRSIFLGVPLSGTTNISNPNLTFTPITIPVDAPFQGLITRRQIADGDTQPLTVRFLTNIAGGSGYTVRVTLAEPACYVQASR